MSNADDSKSERHAFCGWDAENWSNRPLVNADVAAYQVGRLLNVFGFHAQQAWLLGFRCLDDRASVQHNAASGALRTLQSLLPSLRLRNSVAISDIVTEKRRRWDDAEPEPNTTLLRQTVGDANRRQRTPILKFSVGDAGASVSWKLLSGDDH